MYVAAVLDQQEAERSNDDARLAPHLAAMSSGVLAQVAAYKRLTPEQKLEIGKRMYG